MARTSTGRTATKNPPKAADGAEDAQAAVPKAANAAPMPAARKAPKAPKARNAPAKAGAAPAAEPALTPAVKPAPKVGAKSAAKGAKSGAETAAKPAAKAAKAKAPRSGAKLAADAVAATPAPERAEAPGPKQKLVRDSFTMPENEYVVLAEVKRACLKAGFEVKKSELLRIGLAMISQIDVATLQSVLADLPQLKTGRPRSR